MKTPHYQKGAGVIRFILGILIVIFIVFTAVKVVPPYIENYTIRALISSDGAATKGDPEMTLAAYKALFMNRLQKDFDINSVIDVTTDKVTVYQEGDSIYANLKYDVIVQYLGNVSLIIHFDDTTKVN